MRQRLSDLYIIEIEIKILKHKKMKTRIYFLDNLRTFLIFLVVVIHAGLVYESVLQNQWIVVDSVKNDSIGLIRMYLDLFVMFMIFFISGYFVRFSVQSKSVLEFVKSKFNRIILPWIVAVLTLIPAYKILFLYSRGLPQQEWFTYFHLYERAGSDLSFYANNPAQNWLWFLPALFLFQVIYLALSKTQLLSMKISLKTGVVLVFFTGVIYSMIISVSGLKGWVDTAILHFQIERIVIYFASFLLGTLCNKLNVFESNVKNRKYYIISNVVLAISMTVFTIVALNLFYNMIDVNRNYYFVSEWIDKLVYYISALLLMLSFLHIFIHAFRWSLNKSNSLMNELNKNSYFVYIIHVIVMGIFALILMKISLPAYLKFFILTLLTFTISNCIIFAYRRVFQKFTSTKMAATIVIAAVLLTLTVYANQAKSTKKIQQSNVSQTETQVPGIGIHEAVIEGNLEAVIQHIKAGSNLNEKELSGGSSPLIMACVFGKTEIAKVLIEAGADVNLTNNEGSTPLHTAAFFCRKDIVAALLAKGVDKNIRNNAGGTALESVLIPFEDLKGIYEYFQKTLGPLGLELDLAQIEMARPEIAEMLN